MKPAKPPNEHERIAALREYHVLDTADEQVFDDLTALVAQICQVPIATISLVDETRQWFKSKRGLEQRETPREISFCAHTILQSSPLIIPDALNDDRVADSSLVTGEPHVRFYAGFPLTNPQGYALGSLCAIDRKPRQLTPEQEQAMGALARQVMAVLELRRVSSRLAGALENARALAGLLPICAWCKRIRDDEGYWERIETYISSRTAADFTHGICPSCLEANRPKTSSG